MRKKFEFQGRGANSVDQEKIPGFGHRACHSRVAFFVLLSAKIVDKSKYASDTSKKIYR